MSRCDKRDDAGTRCEMRSQGSIGLMRFCRNCAADLMKWERGDPRLKERVGIQLYDGPKKLSWTEWVPDVALSRERTKASRPPVGPTATPTEET